MIPRFVTDFLIEFLDRDGDLSRLRIYWPGMTAATWPCHDERR